MERSQRGERRLPHNEAKGARASRRVHRVMRGHELRKQVVLFLFIFFDEFFLSFVVEGNKLRDQPVTSPNNSKEKNPRLEKIKALVTPEEGVLMLFLMIT